MATIATAQAGNWSNTATWTGGVVPGLGDIVEAAHVVTVDVDINVASLGRRVGGGAFNVSGTRTVTCTAGINQSSSAYIGSKVLDVLSGATLTYNGSLVLTGSGSSLSLITVNTGATVIVNGNVSASGSSTSSYPTTAIKLSGTCSLTVNGNVESSSAASQVVNQGAISAVSGAATIIVNGNVTGAQTTARSGGAIYVAYSPTSKVEIRGNIRGTTVGGVAVDSDSPTCIGIPGQTTTVSGYMDPISAPWVVREGATVEIVRPDDSMWPLMTGDPITYTINGPYAPSIDSIASVVGSMLAAALDNTPPSSPI